MNRLWHLLASSWAGGRPAGRGDLPSGPDADHADLHRRRRHPGRRLPAAPRAARAHDPADQPAGHAQRPERPLRPCSAPSAAAPQPALFDLVDALHSAAEDPRVEAVVAELGDGQFDLAQNQAIAAALAVVRAAGKPTYAYTDSFGEMSPGYAAYHLASAFDEIWLQPVGQLAATGIALESRFYGDLLESARRAAPVRLPRGVQDRPAPPAVRQLDRPAGRDDGRARRRSAGPDRGRDRPWPQADDRADPAQGGRRPLQRPRGARARPGRPPRLPGRAAGPGDGAAWRAGRPVLAYLREIDRRYVRKDAPSIGLVPIDGQIARGSGTGANLLGGQTQGAASVARSIQHLAEQERIKAIILRVDSPGGSPAAAETIHRAVSQAQAKGKLVIVSMASIAGSGAYWLAAGADAILAEPATLTGSIGVVGGKLDLSRLTAGARRDHRAARGRTACRHVVDEPRLPAGRARPPRRAAGRHLPDLPERVADRARPRPGGRARAGQGPRLDRAAGRTRSAWSTGSAASRMRSARPRHAAAGARRRGQPGPRRPSQRPARAAGALRQPGRPPRQLLAPRARNLTVAHHGLNPTLSDRKRP